MSFNFPFNLPTTIQLYFQFTHNFSGVISIYLLSDSIRAWEIETHMSVGAPMSNTSATQKRVSIYHYIAVRFSIYQRPMPTPLLNNAKRISIYPPRFRCMFNLPVSFRCNFMPLRKNEFQFTHHIAVRFSIYRSHVSIETAKNLGALKLIEITVFSKCNSHCPVN